MRAESSANVLPIANILSAGHVKGHGGLLGAGELILRASEIRLSKPRGLIDVINAGLLSRRERGDKSGRVIRVRLKRNVCSLLGTRIDRVISSQNLWWDLDCLG